MKATELISKVKELASDFPHAVYSEQQTCYYTRGRVYDGPDTPGCIFGQALREDYYEILVNNDQETITDVLELIGIDFDGDQGDWFLTVQEHQDKGEEWSEAVAIANAQHPLPSQ